MNQVEKLIAEICPGGVEHRAIGDFSELVRGNGMPKSDFVENGVGCIHYGQIYTHYGIWTSETISFVPAEKARKLAKVNPGDLIVTNTSENVEDVCKAVAWIGESQIVTGGHATVLKHNQNPKYLSYYMQTPNFSIEKRKRATGTKVMDVSAKKLAKICIPLPPLEIQHAIVGILDKFTELESELKAELDAELEARKRQYQYYRDGILNFSTHSPSKKLKPIKDLLTRLCSDGVEFKELHEIFEIKNGYTPSKKNPDYWTNGSIPWFRMDDIRKNGRILSDSLQHVTPHAVKNEFLFPANSIIIATTATIGEHALITVDSLANQRFTFLTPKVNRSAELDMKFMFYYGYVLGEWCRNNTNAASFASVNMKKFKKFKIPIPPLEVQKEIVTILDRFDALVNDLSHGLPAEITARRKQYEYYRDRLLTFKEAE